MIIAFQRRSCEVLFLAKKTNTHTHTHIVLLPEEKKPVLIENLQVLTENCYNKTKTMYWVGLFSVDNSEVVLST